MKVYEGKIADDYRNKFVETFVDCKSAYYQERIQVLQKFTDGDCYTGYLWDCLKSPIVDSEEAECLSCRRRSQSFSSAVPACFGGSLQTLPG